MTTLEHRLRRVIQSVRSRAQIHGIHVSEYETRTRYALIDPVLSALGWNLADPTQVKFEFEIEGGKVDYALFKSELEHPAILVEAKRLTPKGADEFKEIAERKQVALEQSWVQFRQGNEFEKRADSLAEGWARILTEGNESQLGRYADDLQLQAGYGVLTNGNEWQIYDMSIRGSFPDKLIYTVNILTAPDGDSAEKLTVLWRGNKNWPGT